MSEDILSSTDAGSITQAGEQIKNLNALSKSFGKSLADAFASGIVQGRKFEDVLKSLGQRLVEFGLKAAFKPIELSFSGLFDQGLKGSVGTLLPSGGGLGGLLLGDLFLGGHGRGWLGFGGQSARRRRRARVACRLGPARDPRSANRSGRARFPVWLAGIR